MSLSILVLKCEVRTLTPTVGVGGGSLGVGVRGLDAPGGGDTQQGEGGDGSNQFEHVSMLI